MTAPQRTRRRGHAADRLLNPTLTAAEIACDYALAPFDRASRDMGAKWGIDRLPELVSPQTAARWGQALAGLNQAIDAADPAQVQAWAEVCQRGLAAMDAEAAQHHQPANPQIWEYEYAGFRFGIFHDGAEWQAAKRKRPDLLLYSMQEVAAALQVRQRELPEMAERLLGPKSAPAKNDAPIQDDEPGGLFQ